MLQHPHREGQAGKSQVEALGWVKLSGTRVEITSLNSHSVGIYRGTIY